MCLECLWTFGKPLYIDSEIFTIAIYIANNIWFKIGLFKIDKIR